MIQKIFLGLSCLLFAYELSAQQVITGTITDAQGEPLIGASVVEVTTSNGTVADFDGNYELKLTTDNAKLRFSFMGYVEQEVDVAGRSNINITLAEDVQQLEEVVVTALGIKREKKMLGYAVQELTSEQLQRTSDPSVTSALQGKVAGMQLTSAGTGLSGSTKITIRGNSSLSDNNQPLWIVDGVPFDDTNTSGASYYGGVDRGGASTDINPEDIETISVLKGANAAALYGSRAGNGVILITTKKGSKSDGFGIAYNGSFTWTQVSELLNRQHEYGQGDNGVYNTSTFSWGGKLDGSLVTAWNGEQLPYSDYSNSFKDYFQTGFSHNHNVSIGKTYDKGHFRFSFGNSNSKGLFVGESLRKFNLDLNAGMKLNKWFSMDGKISASNTKALNRPEFGVWGEAYQFMLIPNSVRLSDLSHYKTSEKAHVNWVGPTTDYLNPYYVNQQYQNSDERWRAFGYYSAKINFTDWLYLSGKYAFDYYNTTLFSSNMTNGTKYNKIEDFKEDGMSKGQETFFEQNIEVTLAGNNQLGSLFRLGYMVGGNFMRQKYSINSTSVVNMLNKSSESGIVWDINQATRINSTSEYAYSRSINSVFGSLQFAYNDYLSLDVTARNDWSTTLSCKNHYFYPSVSLSWVITDMVRNEFNVVLPSWLTFTKVRGSFAQVGKSADVNQIEYLYKYGYSNAAQTGSSSKNDGIYRPVDVNGNSTLKPEMATSYEAGLDMRFFENRLGLDFTYYYTSTKNQVMKIPFTAPYKYRYINSGVITNSGVEFMIYATPVKLKNFVFDLTVNMSHNESLVKELSEDKKFIYFDGDDKFPVRVGAVEGGRLGEIYANQLYARNEKGELIVGSDGLPRPYAGTDADQHRLDNPIGCIQPKLLMSVTPTFSFYGVSISAMFDMKFGGEVISVSEAKATELGIAARTSNRENLVVAGVTAEGLANELTVRAEDYYKYISTFAEEFVYDASFIKLKELSVGYSFPSKLLSKAHLSSLRLAFVGRNLCYLLKHTPGTSPETGYDTSMFAQAIDFSSQPYSRTFGISLNIGF